MSARPTRRSRIEVRPAGPSADRILGATLVAVDDEVRNLRGLERTLRAAGFVGLHTTTEPREVPELFQRLQPALVLTDLCMPGMSGFELMETLRAQVPRGPLPVLVLTSLRDRETRLRALRAGARDFLTKPFDGAEAVARIRNLVEMSLLEQDLVSHNERLERAVRERTRELTRSRQQLIRRLGRAAEFRDEETGEHILRVARMGALLGRLCGLDQRECAALEAALPMHDVGKIGVPDAILRKPGPLTPQERVVMQTHTTVGAELLSGDESRLLVLARTIALTHHERWDGGGYPRGLAGEDIPLSGRICALVDVFDALCSDRPYKAAWPIQRAVDEILTQAGHQFDPTLVALFLEHRAAFEAVVTAKPGATPGGASAFSTIYEDDQP
jgi:putative two-component system response regulator